MGYETKSTIRKYVSKYDSDYSKNIDIYRGINLKKDDQLSQDLYQELYMYYKEAYENNDKVYIDSAPSSFSFSDSIAKKFAKLDDKEYFSIIFKVKTRITNEINVFSYVFPLYENEEEIIFQTNTAVFEILQFSEFHGILVVELKEILWQ